MVLTAMTYLQVGMQHEKSARASIMRMSDILGGFLWQVLFTQDALNVCTAAGSTDYCVLCMDCFAMQYHIPCGIAW